MDLNVSDTDNPAVDRQRRFLRLLEPVHDNLARFVQAMVRDREDARDLIAETILQAYQRFDTLRDEGAFLSFLFTIARRACRREMFKRRLHALFAPTSSADDHPSNDRGPDTAADVATLYRGLAMLGAAQREAVHLFEIAGLSIEEIRAIQGGTISGVKSRLARGRRRLAVLLGSAQEGARRSTPEIPPAGHPGTEPTPHLFISTIDDHG